MSSEVTITYRVEDTVVSQADGLTAVYTGWSENSPLPPGYRYFENAHTQYTILTTFGEYPPGTSPSDLIYPDLEFILHIDDLSILLPHDSQGNIRANLKPLPDDAWWRLPDYYHDDTYWTGEVLDPVTWAGIDDYWQARGITRDWVSDYLTAHPGSRLS